MAFRKARRLFNITKASAQTLANSRVSLSSVVRRVPPDPNEASIAPDPCHNGIIRRFLHKRASFQPELRLLPLGEKLKSIGVTQNRIRLDGLMPLAESTSEGLTVEDGRKLLRVAQLEKVKERLRKIHKNWIPYSDFIRVCTEVCSDPDQGLALAKMLDESGTVIVSGNAVFLRPDQITKAIQSLVPLLGANMGHRQQKELEEMEKQKVAIDKEADALVRRELWCGLGLLVVQTAGCMRLTFWELSWDVMEPVCFYATSMHCMAGYAFFLRTSKEPSFQGFYQGRFEVKQKRLMGFHGFDIARYNELRRACYLNSYSSQQAASSSSTAPMFNR
ncbi:hypothetical protein F2P56_026515 [Juglans regia]|uniref:Calcium uniporter protein 2, mitochondrial-like n=2 Tax=Juglans regia TaxID=51240 RepID=A0A2I4FCH7_JUGRE|nr:calcium uniporter protein 2, mitochondrial-like [Juglans regia]KAF5451405.1 hypothetical protein F2P56_026515 [Juglans regia]